MKDEFLWLGGAAALGLLFWQKEAIVDVIERGKKVTHAPVGPDGTVPGFPVELAAAAGAAMGRPILPHAYALARMIRSEGAAAGRVRAHVALNDAASKGWDVVRILTYSTNPDARGLFGEQYTPASRAPGGRTSVRRYATSKDPYEGDVVLAERVLAEHDAGDDPTGGAVKFADKSSFGVQEGTRSYAAVASQWAAEGLQPFNVPGYSDDLVVFRRVG